MGQPGGIVLAGGRSSRMGAPKASLEWHGSTLLFRVAGILTRALDGPVVIVGAAGQALPRLPGGCEVVADARAGRGPLEALAAGLGALAGRVEVAFVVSTDTPLLHPAFVAAVVGGLRAEDDICAPVLAGVPQPLAAAYRAGVAPAVAGLLACDELRLGLLLERCRVRRLTAAELMSNAWLARADPLLESLLNLNSPRDYAAARARPAPQISVRCHGGGPGERGSGEAARPARAATLGQAAATAGLASGGWAAALLNGHPAGEDPQLPLVDGDAVTFIVRDDRTRSRAAAQA